ncbi:MAG: hypothetical protein CM15mV29_0800 [uncultured marine virus]|nr:MAG: hypothetical protein CM15mV29_0800 [uncultured marine virus]
MISWLDNRDLGFGFTPPYNGQQLEGVYLTYPIQDKDGNPTDFTTGTPFVTAPDIWGQNLPDFPTLAEGYDRNDAVFGNAPVKAGHGAFNTGMYGHGAVTNPNASAPYQPRLSVRVELPFGS